LDLLESALHSSGDLVEVGCGEVADVALDQRPDALLRVEVRDVGGQLEHGEPLDARGDELSHAGPQVEPNVVPDQDNRAAELEAGADDQVAEVAPAEALRFVLAAPVLADGVDEPGPLAFPLQPGDLHFAEPRPARRPLRQDPHLVALAPGPAPPHDRAHAPPQGSSDLRVLLSRLEALHGLEP
jgi:hypothetical protein